MYVIEDNAAANKEENLAVSAFDMETYHRKGETQEKYYWKPYLICVKEMWSDLQEKSTFLCPMHIYLSDGDWVMVTPFIFTTVISHVPGAAASMVLTREEVYKCLLRLWNWMTQFFSV